MIGIPRRKLLVGIGATATTVLHPPSAMATAEPASRKYITALGTVDWEAVRHQFRLDPEWINLASYFLSSHPRPVREAISRLGRQLDADPTGIHRLSLIDGPTGWDRVRASLAGYFGGSPDEYAPTLNTTVGLGHVYNGLAIRPDQEVLITDREHVAHLGAAILATEKRGASVRLVSLFAEPERATVDEIAGRLRQEIRPSTRVVGLTWVQSSTGVKMPIRTLADVIAEANRDRTESDRCLLVVDGVHGLAAIDTDINTLGADFFVSGTHKWLAGPRGTGLLWSPRSSWRFVRPAVTPVFREDSIANMTPGTFHAFEHMFALPAAVAFHQEIGRAAIAARISELSRQLRDGLAGMPHVLLRTPSDDALSAGLTCFDVVGMESAAVVQHLADRRVRISRSPNPPPYARIGTGITNTPDEIDRVLADIHALSS